MWKQGRIYSEKKNIENRRCYSTPSPEQIFSSSWHVILHELVTTKASVRTHCLLLIYDAPTQHLHDSFKAGNKPTSPCRCFTFQLLSWRNSPDKNASIWNAKRGKSVENHQKVSCIIENTGFAIKYVLYCVIYGWVENLHWWFLYARRIRSLILKTFIYFTLYHLVFLDKLQKLRGIFTDVFRGYSQRPDSVRHEYFS